MKLSSNSVSEALKVAEMRRIEKRVALCVRAQGVVSIYMCERGPRAVRRTTCVCGVAYEKLRRTMPLRASFLAVGIWSFHKRGMG